MHRRLENSEDVVYVDATEFAVREAMTAGAVDCKGKLVTSGTIFTSSLEVAEEAAIAMAMVSSQAKLVVSDSQSAIRNFVRGRLSSEALSILVNLKNRRKVQIVWAPADSSLPGNKSAHDAARGLANRAGGTFERFSRVGTVRDRMVSYRDILTTDRNGPSIPPLTRP